MFDPIQGEFDLAARYRSSPSLAKVKIITEDPEAFTPGGVLYSPIQQAIAAAATGAAALVMAPELSGTSLSEPLFFESADYDVVVFCANLVNVATGGAKQRAFQIGGKIAAASRFARVGYYQKFKVVSIGSVRVGNLPKSLTDLLKGQTIQAAAVRLRTQLEQPLPARVPAPTVGCDQLNVPSNVTVTSVAGAKIYWTTDGSYPGSGNSAAQFANAPAAFQITVPGLVAIAAEVAGLEPSDPITARFTA